MTSDKYKYHYEEVNFFGSIVNSTLISHFFADKLKLLVFICH